MKRGEVRVLVVDDDAGIQRALTARLVGAGYSVTAVGNGNEALRSCEARPPSVVILDVSLPGMDGYQVCEKIREILPEPVTVVFLTGTTHAGTAACSDRLIAQSGGDYFLAKPYDAELLVALLDDVSRSPATLASV